MTQLTDRLTESAKQNSTALIAVVAAAVVVVSAVYWYMNRQAGVRDAALAKLTYSDGDTAQSFMDRCRAVANENVSPEVTRTAWLQVASRAAYELTNPPLASDTTAAKPIDPAELKKIAREAYTKVLGMSNSDLTARGAALYALAMLDENEGKFDAAKKQYEEIKSDKQLAETPFAGQAEYRLSQLDGWARPVKFPPPPPLVLKPEDQAAAPGAGSTPGTFTIGQPPAGVPVGATAQTPAASTEAPKPAAGDTAATPAAAMPTETPREDAAPAPTTQPAAG